MELKILIRTPKGLAKTKGFKLNVIKKILFRKAKVKKEYVNKRKDRIVWIVECDSRHYVGIIRGLTMYDVLLRQVGSNKMIKGALKRMADTPKDYDEVMELLKDSTEVKLLKSTDKDIYIKEDENFFKTFFKA